VDLFSPTGNLFSNPSIRFFVQRFPSPSFGIFLDGSCNSSWIVDYYGIAPSWDDSAGFTRVLEGLAVLSGSHPIHRDQKTTITFKPVLATWSSSNGMNVDV
jgi:hypothetical protein